MPLFVCFSLAQSPSPLLSLNSHHLQPEHHHFSSSCRPTSPSHSLDFSSNQQRRVPCSSVDLSISIQSLRFRSSSAVIVPLRSSSSSSMLFLNDDQQHHQLNSSSKTLFFSVQLIDISCPSWSSKEAASSALSSSVVAVLLSSSYHLLRRCCAQSSLR